MLVLYATDRLKSFMSANRVRGYVEPLELLHIHSCHVETDRFTSSFTFPMPFYVLIAFSETSSIVLNICGKSAYLCLVSDIRGDAFTRSTASVILAVGFSCKILWKGGCREKAEAEATFMGSGSHCLPPHTPSPPLATDKCQVTPAPHGSCPSYRPSLNPLPPTWHQQSTLLTRPLATSSLGHHPPHTPHTHIPFLSSPPPHPTHSTVSSLKPDNAPYHHLHGLRTRLWRLPGGGGPDTVLSPCGH